MSGELLLKIESLEQALVERDTKVASLTSELETVTKERDLLQKSAYEDRTAGTKGKEIQKETIRLIGSVKKLLSIGAADKDVISVLDQLEEGARL